MAEAEPQGRVWLIPLDAEKPEAADRAGADAAGSLRPLLDPEPFMPLTASAFPLGSCKEHLGRFPKEEQSLGWAEHCYRRLRRSVRSRRPIRSPRSPSPQRLRSMRPTCPWGRSVLLIKARWRERGGIAPCTWGVTAGALPARLALDAGTGELSGMPAQEGNAAFTVTLTDAWGVTAAMQKRLEVKAAPVHAPVDVLPQERLP